MAGFDSDAVDWVGMIEPGERFRACLDSRDSAEDNKVLAIEVDASIVILKEAFARRNDAAVAAPNFVKEWRDDSIMHVAGENKIEIIESWLSAFVGEVSRGMDKSDFRFVLREFFEFFRNSVKFINEDINVFIGRVCLFVVAIIVRRKRKAIGVEIVVFVGFVV